MSTEARSKICEPRTEERHEVEVLLAPLEVAARLAIRLLLLLPATMTDGALSEAAQKHVKQLRATYFSNSASLLRASGCGRSMHTKNTTVQ